MWVMTERWNGSGWGGLPESPPAEIAEGAEVIGRGGLPKDQSCFLQWPWSAENGFPQGPPTKSMDQCLELQLPAWPSRKRHRVLCGRLSGSGWSGLT